MRSTFSDYESSAMSVNTNVSSGVAETHHDADWYHGDLAREACESLMSPRETGKFLVRNSNMTRGCYVLSLCGPMRNDGTIPLENYLIKVAYVNIGGSQHPQLTIDGTDYFEDLVQLVTYYKNNSRSIACPLSKPISRRTGLNNNAAPLQRGNRALSNPSRDGSQTSQAQPLLTSSHSQSAFPLATSRQLFSTQTSIFQSQTSVNGSEVPHTAPTATGASVRSQFSERSSPFSTLSHTSLNSVASNHSETWPTNVNGSPQGSGRSALVSHSRSASVTSGQLPTAGARLSIAPPTRTSVDTPSSSASSSLRKVSNGNWQRDTSIGASINNPMMRRGSGSESTLIAALDDALAKFDRDGWLIDPAELQLGDALGGGEFGEVVRGELFKLPSLRQFAIANRRTERGAIFVAVKKLKTIEKLAEFYSEALLMTDLHHTNLVRLIGVLRAPAPGLQPDDHRRSVVEATQGNRLAHMNIWIVTEYCSAGDLVNYLRTHGRELVGSAEQLRFSLEMCAAMRFLEAQCIVHRDLAARNVLLDDSAHCKLSDFGLARRVQRNGATVLAGGDLLARSVNEDTYKFPVKWTAPEAIRTSNYTSKSDVWSFGVLMWEIYSYGAMPYKRMQLNDVLGHIERGYRMECPIGCPSEIYSLMQACWLDSPDSRPTFRQLYESLSDFYNKQKTQPPPASVAD